MWASERESRRRSIGTVLNRSETNSALARER
jgi:hypothetical protein